MVSCNIELTRSAEKEILALDKTIVGKIWPRIKNLANAPHPKGSLKLSGTDNTYRIRVGTYRIIYKIEGDTVKIIGIRHRKEAYR
jgi:mRNA interferase RelE/StbE